MTARVLLALAFVQTGRAPWADWYAYSSYDLEMPSPPSAPPSAPPPVFPPVGCTEQQLQGDVDMSGRASLGDAVSCSLWRLQYGATGALPSECTCMGCDFDRDGYFTLEDCAFLADRQFRRVHLPINQPWNQPAGTIQFGRSMESTKESTMESTMERVP